MIRQEQLIVTVAGSAGSATGSTVSAYPINGRVLAVHIDYTAQPATADVTVSVGDPAQPVLTVSNANTDAWFYPRVQIDTDAGAAVSAQYDAAAVVGYLTASVAQGDAGSVTVTVLVEE